MAGRVATRGRHPFRLGIARHDGFRYCRSRIAACRRSDFPSCGGFVVARVPRRSRSGAQPGHARVQRTVALGRDGSVEMGLEYLKSDGAAAVAWHGRRFQHPHSTRAAPLRRRPPGRAPFGGTRVAVSGSDDDRWLRFAGLFNERWHGQPRPSLRARDRARVSDGGVPPAGLVARVDEMTLTNANDEIRKKSESRLTDRDFAQQPNLTTAASFPVRMSSFGILSSFVLKQRASEQQSYLSCLGFAGKALSVHTVKAIPVGTLFCHAQRFGFTPAPGKFAVSAD